ncbi:MAG: hypothetical protein PHF84_02550 [bacterium]|nr:hypothetical protein [bacterium]
MAESLCAEMNWDGRFYEQAMLFFKGRPDDLFSRYYGLTILDLKVDARPADIVRVRSELEYGLLHPEKKGVWSSLETGRLNVNTLNAVLTPGDFKFTLGRFLPQWGVGKIFRPLDIFTPQTFFLNSLSYQGADGFSAKYYVSGLSSFECILIPSMDIRHLVPDPEISANSNNTAAYKDSVIAGNTEIHLGTFDNYIIALYDPKTDNKVIGLAFKGDAVLGIWGELLYSFRKKAGRDMIRASLGADYSFARYYFITAEYFYDESGASDHRDYESLSRSMPRMTLGEQYLMLDLSVLTYTEQSFGLTGLVNLLDRSFVLFPYFKYEILNNCLLGLSLYHFNGRSGREFSPHLFGNYIFNTYLVVRF